MMRYGNMHLILLDFGDNGIPFMEGPRPRQVRMLMRLVCA